MVLVYGGDLELGILQSGSKGYFLDTKLQCELIEESDFQARTYYSKLILLLRKLRF